LKIKLNIQYLGAFFVIFIIEVLIAVFAKDGFIRDLLGDVLVVVLIYCFVRSFIRNEMRLLPLYIFIFAVLVEVGQYFNLVESLRLGGYLLARIILGTTFDIWDIVCYFVGCAGIWIFEMRGKVWRF